MSNKLEYGPQAVYETYCNCKLANTAVLCWSLGNVASMRRNKNGFSNKVKFLSSYRLHGYLYGYLPSTYRHSGLCVQLAGC